MTPPPRLAVWELTLHCNLHCIHCGSTAGTPAPNELSTTQIQHGIQTLADLGYDGITFMGGEIFLRNDWQQLSHTVKDHNLTLSIVTNGALDTTTIIPTLQRLNPDCLMVGLDAATPAIHDTIRGTPNAFTKTLTFIRNARDHGLPIGIITTVQKMNFTQLPLLLSLIEHEDVYWQIQEATPLGRCPTNIILSPEEYYAVGLFIATHQHTHQIIGAHNLGFHSTHLPACSTYPPWHHCYAGTTVLGITATGAIKGCLTLPDDYIIGNILDPDITHTLTDPRTFTTGPYQSTPIGRNCTGCLYTDDCHGGCTTRSVSMTGQPHNDPHCFHRIETRGPL